MVNCGCWPTKLVNHDASWLIVENDFHMLVYTSSLYRCIVVNCYTSNGIHMHTNLCTGILGGCTLKEAKNTNNRDKHLPFTSKPAKCEPIKCQEVGISIATQVFWHWHVNNIPFAFWNSATLASSVPVTGGSSIDPWNAPVNQWLTRRTNENGMLNCRHE